MAAGLFPEIRIVRLRFPRSFLLQVSIEYLAPPPVSTGSHYCADFADSIRH